MKIGFIGTGHISKSVINGILGSKLKINKIIVSKRNSKISSELKRKSKKIKISTDNQDIINQSNWVFLAITPKIGKIILPKLKFKKGQTIISFISTIKMTELKKYITSLFLALSEDAVLNSRENLKNLVKESQTPKGLNEQGVKELTKAGFYRSLERTLNSIHKRLNK